MLPVNRSRALSLAGGLALSLAVALPTLAAAQQADPPPPVPVVPGSEADPPDAPRGPLLAAPAEMSIRVAGAGDRRIPVNKRAKVLARMKPFVDGEEIRVRISRNGKKLKERTMEVKQVGSRDVGKVKLTSKHLLRSGKYKAKAWHDATPAQEEDEADAPSFRIKYPNLNPGQRNRSVSLFNRLLRRQAYYVSTGSTYGDPTRRAVMAFRKANGMSRNYNATSKIFQMLADGKGGYRLARPGLGRHVEVDISRQVMVLAQKRRAQHIFHVSTGAPSTPSDRGTYRFYRRDAGYNSIGMYYSVYYNRGEAIHGYKSVPPYNASHGCIRNPIPNSRFIYNWVRLGMPIVVHR